MVSTTIHVEPFDCGARIGVQMCELGRPTRVFSVANPLFIHVDKWDAASDAERTAAHDTNGQSMAALVTFARQLATQFAEGE